MDLRISGLALAFLLRDETDAGSRVSPTFDHKKGYPAISLETVGDAPWRGYNQGTDWRVAIKCHAHTLDQARKVYAQARDILLPPAHANEGYHGVREVDLDGQEWRVHFSGVALNAGPSEMEDLPTGTPMLESYWMVPHWITQ